MSSPQPPGNGDTGPDRRQFLTGRTTDDHESVRTPPPRPEPLFSFSANAMGSRFQILCSRDAQRQLAPRVSEGFELLAELEQQMSFYRHDSEISQINRLAFEKPVPVEPRLLGLLQRAIELSTGTFGAFDITTARVNRLWKTARCEGRVPDAGEILEAIEGSGSNRLAIDERHSTIAFAHRRLQIDLGGIGKGYALDRLTELLTRSGAKDFLVHGGQSSVVARGLRGVNLNDSATAGIPWRIGISHPLKLATRLAELNLENQCAGTSGSGRQSFIHGGRRLGHVIDPRTGWPADHWLSVTVLADDATTADVLATALFVMNRDEFHKFIQKNTGIGIIALRYGKTEGDLVAEVANIARERVAWLDSRVNVVAAVSAGKAGTR